MAFSAVETAFSGFKLVRREPRAVAVWTVAMILGSFLSVGVFAALAGPELAKIQAGAKAPLHIDWAAFGIGYLALIAFLLLFAAVIYTAAYRAVVKPGESRFFFLRLGAEELRMMGLYLLLLLIFAAAMMVIWLALLLVFVLAGVGIAAGGQGASSALSGLGAVLAILLAIPAIIAVACWIAVRTSLAAPMTLDTGRISIGKAWKLTRGHFWPLLGAYALSWVVLFVLQMVSTILAMSAAAAFGGGAGGVLQMMNLYSSAGTGGLAEAFAPARLAYTLGSSILGGIYMAVWLAPGAAAYRALSPSGDVAETFA